MTYVKSLQTSNTDIITLLQSFISNPNQIFNQFEAFVSKKFGEAELRSIWTYTEEVQITVIWSQDNVQETVMATVKADILYGGCMF